MTGLLVVLFSAVTTAEAHVLSEPPAALHFDLPAVEAKYQALRQESEQKWAKQEEGLHTPGQFLNSIKDEKVNVAFLLVGHHPSRVDQTYAVMDAILEFTTVPVEFYFIVDEQSVNLVALRSAVRGVQIIDMDMEGLQLRERMKAVASVAQGDGKISIPKLYTSYLLPDVDKLIVLDSDILVVEDILKLWRQFDEFEPTDIAGMALAQDGFYELRGASHRSHEPADPTFQGFNKTHPGYNAGVMLQNLKLMREKKFVNLLEDMVHTSKAVNFTWPHPIPDHRGVQSLMSEWPFVHKDLSVYTLPNAWNFQLCDGDWDKYEGGASLRVEFQQLYDFPPKDASDKFVPSLLHASCGSSKEFIRSVQKEPSSYSAMLTKWCETESQSLAGKEFCRVCDHITPLVEKRLGSGLAAKSVVEDIRDIKFNHGSSDVPLPPAP